MSELETFLLVVGCYLFVNLICLICFLIFHKDAWESLKGGWEKFAFVIYMLLLGWFYWLKVLIDYIAYLVNEKRNKRK